MEINKDNKYVENIIDFFNNKKILILGLGVEGKSALKFLLENLESNDTSIFVLDKNKDKKDLEDILNSLEIDKLNIKTKFEIISNSEYEEIMEDKSSEQYAIKNIDILLKSPGIKLKDNLVEKYRKKIYSQIEIFLKYFNGLTIGVTGTKGKSTTSSLIHFVLSECGYKSHLLGNIGNPVFNELNEIKEKDIAVIELSSFALEFIDSPTTIAAITNIFVAHLDYHNELDQYIDAKIKIFKNIDNSLKNNTSNEKIIEANVKGINKYIGEITENFKRAEYLENFINVYNEKINVPKSNLIGEHNNINIKLVKHILLDLRKMGYDKITEENIDRAIGKFNGLHHRLEVVYEDNNVRYINDSIATVPESTINGIKAVTDLETLILGGDDKMLPTQILIDFINNLKETSLKNIILLPDSGERIKKDFNEKYNIIMAKDVRDAVRKAGTIHKSGSILLSPAARSYGHYKNFEDRGNQFKEEVLKLVKGNI